MKQFIGMGCVALLATSSAAWAQLDGTNLGAGLPLLATQNSPGSFGDAVGGGQDSAGGGEVDQMWGDIAGGNLNLSVSGNIEGNFNKFWIFVDSAPGGENVLQADNVDGGFNEIQNMAGMTFDAGFDADYAIRVEIGSGFYGIRLADLVNNTAGDILAGGGWETLPVVAGVGGFGTTVGWDNSNTLGVTGTDASGAATATTGLEFQMDLAAAFGDGGLTSLKVMAIYGDGGAGFMSNQVLPGVNFGAGDQLGNTPDINFNNYAGDQFAVVTPEPASLALLALGGLALIRRR